MAASMTVTIEGNPFLDGVRDSAKIIIDWISHTDGAVSLGIKATKNTAEAALGGARIVLSKIRGKLRAVETAPGLNGDLTTALPTNLYDITLLDQYGEDVVDGNLANQSGTVADSVVFGADTPLPIDTSELTVTIAAAGDTKKGRIILFIDPMGG